VKVYTTKVALDGEVDGLKPGMSAEVRITVADALDQVLTVPIEAIVGSAEMGGHRRCYVMTPDGPKDREIVVGMSNERIAEVREGLQEGDEVVLNPKTIIGDKMKTRQPGSGHENEDSDSQKGPGKGKKGRGPGSQGGAPTPGEAGPTGGGPPRQGGDGQVSAEERQKQRQARIEQFKNASPEQRKEMLEKIPEEFRERFKEGLKASGIEVP
jgi:HlyD family secretion protein